MVLVYARARIARAWWSVDAVRGTDALRGRRRPVEISPRKQRKRASKPFFESRRNEKEALLVVLEWLLRELLDTGNIGVFLFNYLLLNVSMRLTFNFLKNLR